MHFCTWWPKMDLHHIHGTGTGFITTLGRTRFMNELFTSIVGSLETKMPNFTTFQMANIKSSDWGNQSLGSILLHLLGSLTLAILFWMVFPCFILEK